jgi:hypothetical protein
MRNMLDFVARQRSYARSWQYKHYEELEQAAYPSQGYGVDFYSSFLEAVYEYFRERTRRSTGAFPNP